MALNLRELFRKPEFLLGLFLRLALILLISPDIQRKWFIPFLDHFFNHPTLDPWGSFLRQSGDPMSFPYGPVMLLFHVPGGILKHLVELVGLNLPTQYILGLDLLVADFLSLIVLIKLFSKEREVLIFYWLSPIILYMTYWHGQNDIIPVMFLILCLAGLKESKFTFSGLMLGLAVAAKLSMLLAAPVLLIYFILNNKTRRYAPLFFGSFLLLFIATQGLYSLNDGFVRMVYGSPEIGKLYYLSAEIGRDLKIYLIPLIYILAVYMLWRMGKINYDLLMNSTGIVFFLVILLTPASPGWFIWTVPFLVYHQISTGMLGKLITTMFSGLLIGYHFAFSSGASLGELPLQIDLIAPGLAENLHLRSLYATIVTALGIVLIIRMTREGIYNNDYYRLNMQPFKIGVTGNNDGAYALFQAIFPGLFEKSSILFLDEDRYRLKGPGVDIGMNGRAMNKKRFDLFRAINDFRNLTTEKRGLDRYASFRHMFMSAYLPRELVIVSGYDIFCNSYINRHMDMNISFIAPGVALKKPKKSGEGLPNNNSDLSLEFMHVNPRKRIGISDVMHNSPQVKVRARIRQCDYYENLMQALVGVCALKSDMQIQDDDLNIEILIEGDVDAEDIELAAEMIVPHLEDITALKPEWKGNAQGIVQLLLLSHLAHSKRNVRI